jgi:imidazoleglycerol-phosphate dehydratase/histidinol-phosphatase
MISYFPPFHLMNKLLFIDRDGTLILEPDDQQIDSLEKLEFVTGVFRALGKIADAGSYELVMVTNQDGLGTKSFPEDTFWPAHQKMIKALANENIHFAAVHIDRSLPSENKPTRKPGTAMLTSYMSGNHDLKNSYVIGDRLTDLELAVNLGCRGILLNHKNIDIPEQLKNVCVLDTNSWDDIAKALSAPARIASVSRKTRETDIKVGINLDGSGKADIHTGLGFFDHMLEQLVRHGMMDLEIRVQGDLHIDEHHTIEDTALTLGEAFSQALSDKRGMERYGYCLPMDDSLAQVAVDFGGRPWLVWNAEFKRERIGDVPCEMFFHFFKSFSDTARCNLNISCEGENEHHKIEAIFKAFARAIRTAVRRDPESSILPSTKGTL